MSETRLIWFRKDLRLADNPVILEALVSAPADTVFVFLYIVSEDEDNSWASGAAFKSWLELSLKSLDSNLEKCGGSLLVVKGQPAHVLLEVCQELKVTQVFWGRQYEAFTIARDTVLKKSLIEQGFKVSSVNSSLLQEPWEGVKEDKTPFLVYTPFWKNFVKRRALMTSQAAIKNSLCSFDEILKKLSVKKILQAFDLQTRFSPKLQSQVIPPESLRLRSELDWDLEFFGELGSVPGENEALKRLQFFLDHIAKEYRDTRDLPAVDGTSRLSAYLAHGEISPVRIWTELEKRFGVPDISKSESGVVQYFKEVVWREFSYHLLFHFPTTPDLPLKKQYVDFPWESGYEQNLADWKKGLTGYPIVDAGMRQLWRTGWMHNRVRMIAASFLIKHLLIPWNEGARWFWDTLVDADLASNTQGWQWTAGCGADASPFFRVFNPILQGEKFDPNGDYVRKFVPELKDLPAEWIHKPFDCPPNILKSFGVELGVNYPKPLIEHGEGRQRALLAFSQLPKRS